MVYTAQAANIRFKSMNSSSRKLEVRDLVKSYRAAGGRVQAVRGVSFSLHKGEILALIGPNGSGKTTTLQCISGLTLPDKGQILIDDNIHVGSSQRLSYLSGDSEFYWMFSGATIIKNYARLYGTTTQRIELLVKKFRMEGRLNRKWHQYSSGEQMRIRLIRALLNDPDILLLDEPTSGLDPVVAEALREELAALRNNGKAILLTSHQLQDIERLADRVCFLANGQVIQTGPLTDFSKPLNKLHVTYLVGPNSIPTWMSLVENTTFALPLDNLADVTKYGQVSSIHSCEESLENYFIRISTSGEHLKGQPE